MTSLLQRSVARRIFERHLRDADHLAKSNMQPYDFEESVGYWLTVVTQAYHRALNEQLAPYGVTYRQSHVLGWLMVEGELTQGELARRMMIDPPTLVRILDRME